MIHPTELASNHTVDPITQQVSEAHSEVLIGVLQGDPTNQLLLKADLVHLSGTRGMLGQCVALLALDWDKAKRNTYKIKSIAYYNVINKIKSKQLVGKLTEEGINNHVHMTDEYQEAAALEDQARCDYWRYANLRGDLENMENTLKKVLDHGKD